MAHEWCALLLDYDGTLTPIVDDPAAAHLSLTMRQVVHALLGHRRYRVALVSGRSLADLRTRIDDPRLYLAGNHGLEITAPGMTYCHPQAMQLRPHLTVLARELRHELQAIPGVWVEDKGLTLTVHMRQVQAAHVPIVQQQVCHRLGPDLTRGVLTLRTGKAVLEIRPAVTWGKGEAVRWLVERMQHDLLRARGGTIYIGDDETDEDAFQVLDTGGIGIVVGSERHHSAAAYAVASPEEVGQFLTALSTLRWSTEQ